MKHLLKILFLLPLFLSCTNSQEDIPTKEEEQTAIGFAAMVEDSRAVAELEDVQNNGFSVWGGFGNTNVFDPIKVTYTDADGWGYGETRYWTYNNIYNFYAVYPIGTSATYNVTNNTFTINNYNVNKQVDLLFAKSEDHQYPKDGATVDLQFTHLLANISIQLKANDTETGTIEVTGIYIEDLRTQADYSVDGWKNWAIPSSVGTELATAVTLTDTYAPCGDEMLVIPQKATYVANGKNQQIRFKITCTYNGEEIPPHYFDIPQSPEWDISTKIVYKATVFVDKIEFSTPTVEPWGHPQSGDIVII